MCVCVGVCIGVCVWYVCACVGMYRRVCMCVGVYRCVCGMCVRL